MDTHREGAPAEKAENKEREPENESTKTEEKEDELATDAKEGDDEVEHEGGCHCGEVRWRVRAPLHPVGSCTIIFTG